MSQSKEQTTVEPVENKAQEFVAKYNKLVEEYGHQLMTVPAWRLRDDGTWSLVLQTQVAELPKEKTE